MKSGKIRIGAWCGILLSVLIITGCERGAAQDPLAATTGAQGDAAAQDTATPTSISIPATSESPVATPTQLAAVTNTPEPTPIPVATTPVPTTPIVTPAPPTGGTTYTVKAGDRLFSIGRQYGVNPYSIAQANGIVPPYIIRPGQVLKIPGSGTVTPVPGGKTHVVAPGENLFRIALRYGTTVQALAAANNIANVNLIFVGQVLTIP